MPEQVQLRCPPYFAALCSIYAGCRKARPATAAHLDKHAGGSVQGDGVNFPATVAHVARHDAQAGLLQVPAGAGFGKGTGGRALGRGGGALHAMLPAETARFQNAAGAGATRAGAPWRQGRATGIGMDKSADDTGGATGAGMPGTDTALWEQAGLAQQDFPAGLYVVATPLGNAADMSLRALWVLGRVDAVAAEDTRTTAPLLARFGIHQRLLALHQHNEAQAASPILERLARGERVALVSDAGTPAISDPGALLVRAALAAGIRVLPVPGPSSMTAALCVAGIRTSDIRFVGFAPGKAQARRRHWIAIAASDAAVVLFEAPHRIEATARELAEVLDPRRRIVVARELTKKFETVVETTAAGLLACVTATPPRGEYVLVIDALSEAPASSGDAGADAAADTPPAPFIDPVTARWLAALAGELPASRAAALAARASGLPRALLYRALGAAREDPGTP